MLPAMKVNENYKIITLLRQRDILAAARYTEALVKKLEELVSVVLLLMRQQFLPLSTEIMLRKEI
jgi:hypothetical protein